jgi:hypothetical protein
MLSDFNSVWKRQKFGSLVAMNIFASNTMNIILQIIYNSGPQPGVCVPPGVREDILGVRENILRGM